MKEVEQFLSFMTVWNNINCSKWLLNDLLYEIFKTNI